MNYTDRNYKLKFITLWIRLIVKDNNITYQNTFVISSPSIYLALNKMNVYTIQMIYNYRFICPNASLYTNNKICEKCVKGIFLNAIKNKCVRNNLIFSVWYALIVFIMRKCLKVVKKINVFVVPDNFLKNKLIDGGINPRKIRVLRNPFISKHKDKDIIYNDNGYFYSSEDS